MKRPMILATAIAATMLFAACGSSSDKTTATTTVTYKLSMPADGPFGSMQTTTTTAPDFNRWVARWCEVTPGMSRDQAIAIMGAPTNDAYSDTISWDYRELGFTAFLRSDNTIWQTQYGRDELSDAQRASLTCPSPRR